MKYLISLFFEYEGVEPLKCCELYEEIETIISNDNSYCHGYTIHEINVDGSLTELEFIKK